MPTVAPARRAAFDILGAVERGTTHSDVALRSPAVAELTQVDRNLTTALVMGVLRWQIALDGAILPLLARPSERPPAAVMLSLRMAAFQLLHLEKVPVHAAVNESVELCRAAGQPQAAGMVNAVLRRLLRERTQRAGQPPIFESTATYARRLGHPAWLAERWVRTYGRETAMRICEAGQREPQRGGLLCSFGSEQETPGAKAEDGGAAVLMQDGLPGESSREPGGKGPASSASRQEPARADREGISWDPADAEIEGAMGERGSGLDDLAQAMDDGSRLVAELIAAAAPHARRIWDCCAAPGGKAAVLLGRLPQATLLASDASAPRLAAMQRRFAGTEVSEDRLRFLPSAAETLPEGEGVFDLVLCDVPCSGTGTLGRNPEIRHRLRSEDLTRQNKRQREILAAALQRVGPGGCLVYATCSLEPEECEAVVDEVARGWVRVALAPFLGQLAAVGMLRSEVDPASLVQADALRTVPGVHPSDGFFAAVLQRAHP